MHDLIEILAQFPTAIYTVPLGVLMVFWAFAVLGAIDIDMLTPDVDFEPETPGFVGLMHTMGFAGVPVTVVLSFIVVIAWILTLLSAVFILPLVPTALLQTIFGIAIILASFFISLPITAKAIAPLARLNNLSQAKSNADYVGSLCRVSSSYVDDEFGQGEVETGGASLLVNIRLIDSARATKNSLCRIAAYDKQNNLYRVVLEQAAPE